MAGGFAWSPEGHSLLLAVDSELRLVTVADESVRPIVTLAHDPATSAWSVSWSPDGQHFAYTTNKDALWVANADGSAPEKVADTFDAYGRLAWAP